MTRVALLLTLLGTVMVPVARLSAHCEVPCGIFSDQRRFEEMLEDQETIAKANAQLADLVGQMQDGPTTLTVNQACRWIDTKEDHATRIQHTIAQYFMSQRIKSDDPAYTQKLTLCTGLWSPP